MLRLSFVVVSVFYRWPPSLLLSSHPFVFSGGRVYCYIYRWTIFILLCWDNNNANIVLMWTFFYFRQPLYPSDLYGELRAQVEHNHSVRTFFCNWLTYSKLSHLTDIFLVGRVFTHEPGDRGSIPGRFIPKTQNMVLVTSLHPALQGTYQG